MTTAAERSHQLNRLLVAACAIWTVVCVGAGGDAVTSGGSDWRWLRLVMVVVATLAAAVGTWAVAQRKPWATWAILASILSPLAGFWQLIVVPAVLAVLCALQRDPARR